MSGPVAGSALGQGASGADAWLLGVFVGGRSSRMGSPKGLLPSPSDPNRCLVESLVALGTQVGLGGAVLVGRRPEYAHLSLESIPDPEREQGPLAGFVSLLGETRRRGLLGAVALACDTPYLTAGLLTRLLTEQKDAELLCCREGAFFQPLFSRLTIATEAHFRASWGQGERSLQPVFRSLRPQVLELDPCERSQLRDWDTPADVRAALARDGEPPR